MFVLCFDSYYKLQLGVERHIPKLYTFKKKIQIGVHKSFLITDRVKNLTLYMYVIITDSVEITDGGCTGGM